ncbi:MAG TPA: hypothetical protein VFP91_22535, partial [Vicinamibacterales bacterium]|nr:hypothetical protein [Vicinamibacterales bacterium]
MSERGPDHNRTRPSAASGRCVAAAAAACVASLTFTAPAFAQTATTASSGPKPAVRQVNVLPLSFEEQRQDPNAAPTFVSRSPGHALTVSADQAALTVRGTGASGNTLRMTLSGARAGVEMTALDALPGKVYHATSDSRGLQSGNTTYRRVKGSGIYPGIDLIYYGSDRQLEFDFVVAPRADARQIRLAFSGADSMTLEPGGELAFRLGGEVVRLKKPRLYQE